MEEVSRQVRIIRRQLGRWWLGIGSWWLLILLLTSILDIEPLRLQYTWGSYGSWPGFFLRFDWWRILLLCFWLYAAAAAYSLLARLEQSAALPHSPAASRAKFVLLYLQGVPGLLVVAAGRLFSAWLFYKSLPEMLHNPAVSAHSVIRAVDYDVLPLPIAALFLIALLMLEAGRPLLPWLWLAVLASAQLIHRLAAYRNWWELYQRVSGGAIYEFQGRVWYGLAISAALYWGLLLLFRYRRRQPALVLFAVLLTLTIAEALTRSMAAPGLPGGLAIPGLITSHPLKPALLAPIITNITGQASFLPAYLAPPDAAAPHAGQSVLLAGVPMLKTHVAALAAAAVVLLNTAWLTLLLWLANWLVSRTDPR